MRRPDAGTLGDSFRQFADGFVDQLPNLLARPVLVLTVARLVRRWMERALVRADAERHVRVVVATLAFYAAVGIGLVVALAPAGSTSAS